MTILSLTRRSPATTKAALDAGKTNVEEAISTVEAIRDTEEETTRDTEGAIRDTGEEATSTAGAIRDMEEAIKVKVATVVIKVTDVSDTQLNFLSFSF
jgi:hypothetical protein